MVEEEKMETVRIITMTESLSTMGLLGVQEEEDLLTIVTREEEGLENLLQEEVEDEEGVEREEVEVVEEEAEEEEIIRRMPRGSKQRIIITTIPNLVSRITVRRVDHPSTLETSRRKRMVMR